ncbi:MAG: CoA pyrophosphatase [Geothermobacteraceae bacterium]
MTGCPSHQLPLRPLPDLAAIRAALGRHRPVTDPIPGRKRAAVAMLLRGSDHLEMLFIERSRDPRDPWSGNLAFPGGRIDPEDTDERAAAERETREEVGLDLAGADCLGRLDDIRGAYLPVQIACFVYHLSSPQEPVINHEVSDLFWFPASELLNPRRHGHFELLWAGKKRTVRAIDLLGSGRPVLWGITYRLVTQFMVLHGCLPDSFLEILDD